ncbi:helix-turn-helix domain-containing protein, partial [Frankia sp. AgW1.1]|uniref:MarR family transcriptional regulator n=1 Tax=Frankia sp. AgW1.1 TaxID=1836971 RepID=UPI001933531B
MPENTTPTADVDAVPADLTRFMVMVAAAGSPITAKDLAARAGVSRSTAQTALTRLAALGRVARVTPAVAGPGRPAAHWAPTPAPTAQPTDPDTTPAPDAPAPDAPAPYAPA